MGNLGLKTTWRPLSVGGMEEKELYNSWDHLFLYFVLGVLSMCCGSERGDVYTVLVSCFKHVGVKGSLLSAGLLG